MPLWISVLKWLPLAFNVGLSFIPASVARKKGRSFWGFLCLGIFLSFLISLFVALWSSKKTGDPIVASESDATELSRSQNASPQSVVQKHRFAGNYLSLIVLTVILAGAIALAYRPGMPAEYLYLYFPTVFLALVSFSVVITTRAKGPDFSVIALVALSAILTSIGALWWGSLTLGILTALAACAFFGVLHGFFVVYLKIPTIITTVVSAIVIRYICFFLVPFQPVQSDIYTIPDFASLKVGIVPLSILTVIPAAFLVIFFLIRYTRLGQPIGQRIPGAKPTSFFLAYIVGALLSGIAGIYDASLYGVGRSIDTYGNFVLPVLFFFAVVSSIRLADNKTIPAILALGAAVVYKFISLGLNFHGVDSFYHDMLFILLSAIFLIISWIANKEGIRRFARFK